ncbi:MAG TPA: 4-vinyl reductase [Anaerolineae bacterium]|nr:4-vinyl reductase [Anaerolineae bacterium]MCB0178707.1 4-vinyl reductase [Anaerolineae bacterium]MCB0224971.1 4-vinyl reductase [Anaerolineae bacterium]MCB9108291.1 4-vinyl reductase [Anaerolineales bacterium]HRV93454.1 4-vinyl reductase [Anaerolineae bacterium]
MTVKTSGLYYPNKMARMYILSIQETIGAETMNAVLAQAGVPQEFNPPPNDFAQEFDFAYFAGIGVALEKMYGPRGERGLTVHAGRASFAKALAEYGPITGTRELAFKMIKLEAKLRILFKATAESFSHFSDQKTTMEEADDHFKFLIHACPRCWHRTSDKPICYSAIGLLEEGCSWVSGGKKFLVEEVACIAAGAEVCEFHIQKEPLE